jgi:hypothetical protein
MNVTLCKRCGAESAQWTGTCPVCGGTESVSVTPGTDPFQGRTVNGRFKVLKKLGQGGMGSVYEAEDLRLGMHAAVKFLNPELSKNVDLAKRFLSEARTYARVVHPGAVALHDYGQDADGTLYIALELVEGQTLTQLLDERRRLPLSEACDISLQIASVLELAHDKGVVHRDLKPENVMVRKGLHGWHVKLLDFGVARRMYAGATQHTQAGGVSGTPRYMAPEQVRGEEVDGRVDVYALGLLTFEMLTGVPAVDAPDLNAVMAQQLRDGLRPLGSVDPELANLAVDAVLARATHKERTQRFGTMKDFAHALQRAVGDRTQPPPPPVIPAGPVDATFQAKATPYPMPPAAAPRSRNPGLRWIALGLLLGLIGAGGGLAKKRLEVNVLPVGPTAAACAGEAYFDPSLRELSTVELERQVAATPVMLPSVARQQLETYKAQAENASPELRDCVYRTTLLGSVSSTRALLKTNPSLWGHTRDVGRLRSLFLELPLKQKWSPEERGAVLQKIEGMFIANLKAEDDADRDFWRRQYYGIELLCEVSDEALADLHTGRPSECLNLSP